MRFVSVLRSIVVLVGLLSLGPLAQTAQAQGTATPAGTAPLTVLAFAPLSTMPAAPVQIALVRLSYAAGTSLTAPVIAGPSLGVVESGSLAVHATAAVTVLQATPVPPATTDYSLAAGDTIALPANTAVTYQNPGQAPATLLLVTLLPAGTALPASYPAGVTVQSLASGVFQTVSSGPAVLTLARQSLAPGADSPTLGPLLAYVEDGTLAYTPLTGTATGTASARSATPGTAAASTAITVGTGGAIVAQRGAVGDLQNSGSAAASLLLVFLAPAQAGTPTA